MQSTANPVFWIGFFIAVLALMFLDLSVFHRKSRSKSIQEAALWSAFWVALSLLFGAGVFLVFGHQKGLEFFAGYVVEYALSVDNLFVFILLFSYFAVPANLHHRVLFWGILGALIMRLTFILIGTQLLQRFEWIIYIFGAFLVYTGFKTLRQGEAEVDPEHNPVVRLFRRAVPMTQGYDSEKFFVWKNGRILLTPLALVLVTVETTDLVFATDSIPAVFGVTKDPFIVYTSNVCAILGLRSMYFMLAAAIDKFSYLGTGVGLVLIFIGLKMLAEGVIQIPIWVSLLIVAGILAGAVCLSLLRPTGTASKEAGPLVRSDSDGQ
jgi:tellurite resistance protein TerC